MLFMIRISPIEMMGLIFMKIFAELFSKSDPYPYYLLASSIATTTATVIPTMGLLPAPMRPIISM